MDAFQWLCVALAARAVRDFWLKSTLTEGPRLIAEAKSGRLWELLTCPFCLAYHAAAYAVLIFIGLPVLVGAFADQLGPWQHVLRASGDCLLWMLAAAGLIHALDDLSRPASF
jgi:hypothetical protein